MPFRSPFFCTCLAAVFAFFVVLVSSASWIMGRLLSGWWCAPRRVPRPPYSALSIAEGGSWFRCCRREQHDVVHITTVSWSSALLVRWKPFTGVDSQPDALSYLGRSFRGVPLSRAGPGGRNRAGCTQKAAPSPAGPGAVSEKNGCGPGHPGHHPGHFSAVNTQPNISSAELRLARFWPILVPPPPSRC